MYSSTFMNERAVARGEDDIIYLNGVKYLNHIDTDICLSCYLPDFCVEDKESPYELRDCVVHMMHEYGITPEQAEQINKTCKYSGYGPKTAHNLARQYKERNECTKDQKETISPPEACGSPIQKHGYKPLNGKSKNGLSPKTLSR